MSAGKGAEWPMSRRAVCASGGQVRCRAGIHPNWYTRSLRKALFMLRAKRVLVAMALLLMVSVASAQDQPRGRGRGGFGGGFGGMGGMFNNPVGLLGMPEVQKELKLSEEQTKEVGEALAALNPGRGGFNFQELQNLSEEDRQKRMDEMRKKAEESMKAAEEKMNKILKPEQLARLKQLSLQRQGSMALTRPEVAKDLGLTKEQQEKIQEIQASARPQGGRQNFQDLSDEERQKLFAEANERREKAQADMLAVLTDDQKAKFEELKGKEFTFPQPRFGGGVGGGGGERRRPPTKQE
jgi:Spy/CpxP family protein refolding chaperone